MKKNTLLNISIRICNLLKGIYIIVIIFVTLFFLLIQIAPESKFVQNASVNFKFDNIELFSYKTNSKKNGNTIYPIDNKLNNYKKLSISSLYINYIKLIFVFIFSFYAISEFRKIMYSVKHTKTFHSDNITSFRKIGKYLLFVSLAMCFQSIIFKNGAGLTTISIPFETLVLALLAFIMAEIFKEGNNLSEENKLTV